MSSLLSIGEVCRLTNTHPNSIRKYTANGSLRCYRVADNGMRRFRRDDVEEFFGLRKREEIPHGAKSILYYIRCSTGGQAIGGLSNGDDANDLARQKARIQQFNNENFNQPGICYADVGSGLGYENRKGFKRLFQEILARKHDGSTLVLEHKDRACRFGFEVLKWICDAHDIKIIITDKNDETEIQELSQDILNIIHVFSSRSMGLRSAARNTKRVGTQIIEQLRSWRASGKSINAIVKESKTLGFKTDDNCWISYKVCQRILNVESPQLEMNRENSIERFIALKIRRGASGLRLKKKDCYAAYRKFVTENNLPVLSASLVGRKFNSIGIRSSTIDKEDKRGNYKTWSGIYLVDDEGASVLVKEVKKPVSAESPILILHFFYSFIRS